MKKQSKTVKRAPRDEIQPTLTKAVQQIVQNVVENAYDQICEVNHARHAISKINWYTDKPVDLFWNKTSIRKMKKLFGDNFHQGEQILRKLTMINFEIEVIHSELRVVRDDLKTLMETEKKLMSQMQKLFTK